MHTHDHDHDRTAPRTRNLGLTGAIVALLALSTLAMGGCPDATTDLAKKFRDASSSSIQTGVTQVATGFIDGVFALYQ